MPEPEKPLTYDASPAPIDLNEVKPVGKGLGHYLDAPVRWLVLFVTLFSVAGLFGSDILVFELMSHFRVQYLLCLLPCLAVTLWRGQRRSTGLCALGLILNLFLLGQSEFGESPRRSPARVRQTTRMLHMNVMSSNRDFKRTLRYVRETDPDVLVVVEMTRPWQDRLEAGLPDYPYHFGVARPDNFGIGLFSKTVLKEGRTLYFGDTGIPFLEATLEDAGQAFTLLAAHLLPPLSEASFRHRNEQILVLGQYLASAPGPILLVGDLNMSPWSPWFRRLLKQGRVRDSRVGFGLHASWAAENPLLRIPIDHVLVSHDLAVLERHLGPPLGSDHRSVTVEVGVLADPSDGGVGS